MARCLPTLLWLLPVLLPGLSSHGALANPPLSTYEPPRVYLDQANVPRAKGLALDAALTKGWQVAVSQRDHSVFETLIHESRDVGGGADAPPVPVLLRIRADFIRDAGGVLVSLAATEIRSPGTRAEVQRDVTQNYRVNLENALGSLRQQWEEFALGGRPSRQPQALEMSIRGGRRQAPRRPAVARAAASEQASPVTGQWSYEAERLAGQYGCQVSERGATLFGDRAESDATGHEVHRVSCDNRSALLVRCDSEGCRIAQ
ncbi:hypothetical protein Thiowin_01101 [Thiorhodovibrio winogradskyi]|uniref:Lipoprotein n=1 Tax=Thiorhodovibrio winogradskyi TaxID=77007 RepID=A0ABZ0S753_9GAMM|nr:hypothetical protein [Thiorhodovibrio winogradskyi]